ncbi:MAG: UDP-3-O-[3-hydroxymyristoyl] N-acetylglucosamine deacetylase [Bdellovibrionales bacterium RIFOXYC1_FULL_54_43]|nr:MAG: UDP-3-O-[3-hydroxymyristoyl] N-acetylglucosamine deacetylase [Bdellovibrionales bacterium RIFOXYC1_FULL_54_43]OFZ83212.1 MAG: UDP-3-O-[3-hydroxymyristoyl] N-acetylglucosamine deacetylase [Bdellovibrionales bacterium RIFOXYD1_FULL_55_31]
MTFQQTLREAVSLTGIGLHSGTPVILTIKPARANQGISFVRTDLEGTPHVVAHYKNVINTQLATTIGRGRISVSTVEHLLAAFQGLAIDNATVEVNGPELPILDGSAAPFMEAILSAGIESQRQIRPTLVLRRKVQIGSDDKWAIAEPSGQFEIHGSIEWKHPAIGYQEFHYQEDRTEFEELAGARTFGFLRDVETMKRMGLARGGSLENAVVLDDASVLNPGGLRYADEFARHKVLDALGDFKLAGVAVRGFFRLHRAGHDLHSQLLAAIFKDADNYEIIEGSAEERRPRRMRAALASGFVAGIR